MTNEEVDSMVRKRVHICGKGNLFMVEVISGPNVLWQLYRPRGITRAFRQKGHTGHGEHKTLGHFTFLNKQERFVAKTQYAGHESKRVLLRWTIYIWSSVYWDNITFV